MIRQNDNAPFSQRQLRVGEMIKQSLGQIFLRDEAKVPTLTTKSITVTEVRMSPDLKNARAYVIPLGGKDTDNTVNVLTKFSYLIRKALSKKIDMMSFHHNSIRKAFGKKILNKKKLINDLSKISSKIDPGFNRTLG